MFYPYDSLGDNKLGAEGIRELQNVAIELHNLRSVRYEHKYMYISRIVDVCALLRSCPV